MNSVQQDRIDYIRLLFESTPNLFDHNQPSMVSIKAKGSSKVKATLPLKKHPKYGETVLVISEKYNDDGKIIYHYGWEHSQRQRKLSKIGRHITAFGNEDHSGPPMYEKNPYHHHHIPHKPTQRKITSVTDLESVIGILSDYIIGGIEYHESDSF